MNIERRTKDAGRTTQYPSSLKLRRAGARRANGSAIILAVVLTSLLAIIGVIFLLSSRVDSIATSAISENKDLNLAVDTVIAQISEELVWDIPRADANGTPVEEYYDYPDPCNPWLACLEPYDDGFNYRWRQISNIYGFSGFPSQNMIARILPDYNDTPSFGIGTAADADGDGVSDSMWVKIPDKTSSKGKPIYAAIRIVDNSGMLNVNTGFKFDPCDPGFIDGSSQTQINLMALSWRPNVSPYSIADENDLLVARAPLNPIDFLSYEHDVVWQYEKPLGTYTPFDVSDELEMRYRFLLNHQGIDTRLDSWGGEFRNFWTSSMPFQSRNEWFKTSCIDANLISPPDPNYAYRHIATTYNLDRIINPDGDKMLNINRAPQIDPNYVRKTIARAIVDGGVIPADANPLGAQITANLIDYVDLDSEVSVINDDANIPHFGFETPCIYISELVQSFVREPNAVSRSYAIELYKPYATDPIPEPNRWQLRFSDPCKIIPVAWPGNSPFFVISNVDGNAPLEVNKVDANDVNNLDVIFGAGDRIRLERDVNGYGFITVDEVNVPVGDPGTGWLTESNDVNNATHSIQRDITLNKCIRRLWENPLDGFLFPSTLGGFNTFVHPTDSRTIQAHPANQPFTNVGEFGRLFYAPTSVYGGAGGIPPEGAIEENLRIDLTLPAYQQVFKYLTVMDPNELRYGGHPYDETRIKGRININTAPWFVIAQLPWVSQRTNQATDYLLARAMVAYRDRTTVPGAVDYSAHLGLPGLKTIGEMMDVNLIATDPNSSIFTYAIDGIDQPGYPDLTTDPCLLGDGATDDFEERDLIFARISNLVTVRSDVFTAYILVRIGQDGPQKRVVAILDRSGVTPAGEKVKVIAIQSVPDPR